MTRTTRVIDPSHPAFAGQKSYTPALLRTYDLIVLGISNRWIWRCPTSTLVRLYESNVGAHHLDAGPGTGYFLDAATLPQLRRLTLVDANPSVLDYAGTRLERFVPEMVEANLLTPIDHPGGVDSVGCNYVLHCLPGALDDKAEAIANLTRLLRPGGVLFGSTIIADADRHTAIGRRLMGAYNRKGIFGNALDTAADLERVLRANLTHVDVDSCGAVVVFRGIRPV